MGGVIDKVVNIGQTSDADRARTAASDQAKAAQGAAMAREKQLEKSVGFAQQGLDEIRNAQSPQELAALTQALDQQGQNLQRQSDLFASIDPAIMEASQQAFQLLQGQDAKSLAPLKASRERQRKQLVDRLREQLGPGAETSTAGMQALNQFDQQSSDQLFQAQESSMGNLFGMASQGAQNRSSLNQGAQTLGGLSMGATQGRQAGLQGGFANLINAQQGLAAGAGSQFVGAQVKGAADLASANQRQASNTALLGSVAGGLLGPSLGAAGESIKKGIFG